MEDSTLKIIPGKQLAAVKKALLEERIKQLSIKPVLKVIQVGNEPSSSLYVSLKVEAAREIGIDAELIKLPEAIQLEALINTVQQLNADEGVHGIMLQAPIVGFSASESLEVFNAIAPEKDVDGLGYRSLGKLWQLKQISELTAARNLFVAATPLAVLDSLSWLANELSGNPLSPEALMLKSFSYDYSALIEILQGKTAIVINRSNIVGKPLAALLQLANATVTMAHSHTSDLKDQLKTYDFVFPATGKDHLFNLADFRSGQVVVDIGINNNNQDEVVKGDVDFSSRDDGYTPSLWLAPVPGGVGPLTIVNLLANVVRSLQK